jgi:hypothetical protein
MVSALPLDARGRGWTQKDQRWIPTRSPRLIGVNPTVEVVTIVKRLF